MTDFDYHGTINAERYEKYFETICKLLKPNSVIIVDNESYIIRETWTIFKSQNGEKDSFNLG